MRILFGLLCALSFISFGMAPAAAAPTVGRVLLSAGEVHAQRDGAPVPLRVGSGIQQGDLLVVGSGSALQVRFDDESLASLRPNTQLKIDAFQYLQNAESDQLAISLLKGGLRTITGLIGKANQRGFRLRAAAATIGIRGTHFSILDCQDDCVLSDGNPVANGTYGGVTDGKIGVENDAGEVVFAQQEYFHVPDRSSTPRRLLAPPAILIEGNLQAKGRTTPTVVAVANQAETTETQTAETSGQSADSSTQTGTAAGQAEAADAPMQASSTSTSPEPVVITTLTSSEQQGQSSDGVVSAPIEYAAESPILTGGLAEADVTLRLPPPSSVYEIDSSVESNAQIRAESERDLIASGNWNNAAELYALVSGEPGWETGGDLLAGIYWVVMPPNPDDHQTHVAFGDAPTISLPTSGVAQYNYAGSTIPTDNFGNRGSFSGADLSFDFGTRIITTLDVMTMSFPDVSVIYSLPTGSTVDFGDSAATVQNLTGTCAGCMTPTISWSVSGELAGATLNTFAAAFLVNGTLPGSIDHVGISAGGWVRN